MKLIFVLAFDLLFEVQENLSHNFSHSYNYCLFQLNVSKADEISVKLTSFHNISYLLDIRHIFPSNKDQCLLIDLEKVEECYDGHVEVFEHFLGPTKCFGETILLTFRQHIDLLTRWTQSNSTTISAGTTQVLHGLSFLEKLGKNAYHFLIENGKATPKLFSVYRKIETTLKKLIGNLYNPINEALTLLENLFAEILIQFLNRSENCKNINFKGILNVGRLLASRVAFIFETALGDCGSVTIANNVYDALAVTASVLYDSLMAILAVLNTMAAIIFKESGTIPTYLNSVLSVLNNFILGIHKTITSLTTGTAKEVRRLLLTIVEQVFSLNINLVPMLAPFEDVEISAAVVIKNLLKTSGNKATT